MVEGGMEGGKEEGNEGGLVMDEEGEVGARVG